MRNYYSNSTITEGLDDTHNCHHRGNIKTRIRRECGQFFTKEWYARLGSSSKTESMLNRILFGLCKVDCGDFNMREYLSYYKLVI